MKIARPVLLAAAVALPFAMTAPLVAQVEAEPVLSGTVRLGDAAGGGAPAGVEGETVILHRVTPDTAGAIDSVRAAVDGSFSFRLPAVPDPGGRGDIYFASVRHQGILYFGQPVSTAVQLDSLYLIEVHDTVAAPAGGAALPVAIRYLVLEESEAPAGAPAGQGGGWRVTDLIQVRNPRDRTLVVGEDEPVWTYPLPPEASRVQIGGGDIGPDAFTVEGGRLRIQAPLPPGTRQLILRYALESPRVTFPMPGSTESVELLVREPAPPLRVEGLEGAQPVAMETGTTYRRYVGTGLADATIRVQEGEEAGGGIGISPRWIAVLIAVLLGAAGVWILARPGSRRGGGEARAPAGPSGADAGPPGSAARDEGGPDGGPAPTGAVDGPEARRAMLLEIAGIDEALAEGAPDDEEADAMRRRRGELVERLRRAR